MMHTRYFKNVQMVPSRLADANMMNLDVQLEEQPTGELSGGVGWSNINGFMVDAGITENNFMGRGQVVHDGHRADDDSSHNAQKSTITDLRLRSGFGGEDEVIDVQEHDVGSVARATVGQNHDGFIVLEGAGDGQHQDHLQHRSQHGQRDSEEGLHSVCTVNS